MACTREFQLGQSFQPSELPLSNSDLLEDLLHFAYRLPTKQRRSHVHLFVLKGRREVIQLGRS